MLNDLTVTKAERQKHDKDMMADFEDDDIPYGLRIHLSNIEVEKLGIADRQFEVGQELPAAVMLRVSSISDSDHGSGKNRHIGLSVVAMDIANENRLAKAAKTLYEEK